MAAPPLPPLGHHGGGQPAHHTMALHFIYIIYPPIVIHLSHHIALHYIKSHHRGHPALYNITVYHQTSPILKHIPPIIVLNTIMESTQHTIAHNMAHTLQSIITHILEFNWITRIQSITIYSKTYLIDIIYSKTYRRDCLTLSHQGGILSMLLDGSQHATYTYTNCSALSHQPTNNYLPP